MPSASTRGATCGVAKPKSVVCRSTLAPRIAEVVDALGMEAVLSGLTELGWRCSLLLLASVIAAVARNLRRAKESWETPPMPVDNVGGAKGVANASDGRLNGSEGMPPGNASLIVSLTMPSGATLTACARWTGEAAVTEAAPPPCS